MAEDRAGPGFIAFTILGLIVLVAAVALLINSYDTSSDVAAVEAAVASAPAATDTNPQVAPPVAPIGGVATGGGGTATDASANLALLSVGVLATLTLLTGAGMALRQRAA